MPLIFDHFRFLWVNFRNPWSCMRTLHLIIFYFYFCLLLLLRWWWRTCPLSLLLLRLLFGNCDFFSSLCVLLCLIFNTKVDFSCDVRVALILDSLCCVDIPMVCNLSCKVEVTVMLGSMLLTRLDALSNQIVIMRVRLWLHSF